MTQKIKIPYSPRYPQNQIHPQIEAHRFWVLVAHRRLGKSVMAINHIIKKALLNPLQSPRYAYIAPFLRQAKMIAWDYLKRYTAPIPGIKVNESELSVELCNRAKIWLFGADNPESLRGGYWDGVILDEYAQIKPFVFGEIIRPALSDRKGWAGFLGTPKGVNQFLEVYELAMRLMNGGDPDWWAGLYRADETGVVSPDELATLKAAMSDAQFRQEFLCDFSAASDNVLITIDIVSKAANKIITPADILHAPVILGVDPARFGDDRTVMFRRQGLNAFPPRIITKMDNMTVAGLIAQEAVTHKPDAIFIDAGRGEGIIDRCRQIGLEVTEVNFGGQSVKPSYYINKRTEMWDSMKQWLEAGGAIPNLPELKSELVVPSYSFDSANRMKLESKDDIKKRLGKSPDIADSLALTFSFPVMKKIESMAYENSNVSEKYDPFNRR